MRMIPLFAAVAHHPCLAIHVAVVGIAEVDLRAPVAALVLLVAGMAVLAEAYLLLRYWQLDLGKLGLLLGLERQLELAAQLQRSNVAALARIDQLLLLDLPLALVVGASVLVVAVLKLVFGICVIRRNKAGLVSQLYV